MTHIGYFKRQAKNLFKDYKAKAAYIHNLLLHYRFDQNDFSLMKAQHIVALMGGFSKWADLLKSSVIELELAKLLFENQDKIPVEHWKNYISAIERDYGINYDAETRLEVFKHDFEVTFGPLSNGRVTENKPRKTPKPNQEMQITSLPLSKEDRMEFVETANSVFKTVMLRIMPCNPGLTRKLWDVEEYVDHFLTEDMLPISKEYALSLIDAFMVQHALGLAMQADKMAEQS